ncbi:MAG: metallophosphoesterase, partial [Chloroflexales bacterium]|nr:metallophosphoesterase [Chloroflexales bacterium]
MYYKLMHISDLHAGPPFNLLGQLQVAREAHELQPDLLVISGDFVQRADFTTQWRTIAAYLKLLPQPQLVVPGNHDVPMYNSFNRLFRPYARYRRYISATLNPVFELPGLLVAGACTAHGLTVDGGRLSRSQQAAL